MSSKGILDPETPITSANVEEFAHAVKTEGRAIQKHIDRANELYADRIAAARAQGLIADALDAIPLLTAAGLPADLVIRIAAGLSAAGKLIGIVPDIEDTIKEIVE
jgi:hypothetical protein